MVAVVWEVLSCVLIDANISTLVMEIARSPEILSSKLHGFMSQKPVTLVLTAVGTSMIKNNKVIIIIIIIITTCKARHYIARCSVWV